jgi:hypothetical protein
MVGVAQLVEHRVVAPVVVGSSPITHPTPKKSRDLKVAAFLFSGRHSNHFAPIPVGRNHVPEMSSHTA